MTTSQYLQPIIVATYLPMHGWIELVHRALTEAGEQEQGEVVLAVHYNAVQSQFGNFAADFINYQKTK